MKPLTLEETALKEEMKKRCLVENAKAKFDMLCHLEDFEIQYWELQNRIDEAIKYFEENYYTCLDFNSGKRCKKLYHPEKIYDLLKKRN